MVGLKIEIKNEGRLAYQAWYIDLIWDEIEIFFPNLVNFADFNNNNNNNNTDLQLYYYYILC